MFLITNSNFFEIKDIACAGRAPKHPQPSLHKSTGAHSNAARPRLISHDQNFIRGSPAKGFSRMGTIA